jgi:hypothetical protein
MQAAWLHSFRVVKVAVDAADYPAIAAVLTTGNAWPMRAELDIVN